MCARHGNLVWRKAHEEGGGAGIDIGEGEGVSE